MGLMSVNKVAGLMIHKSKNLVSTLELEGVDLVVMRMKVLKTLNLDRAQKLVLQQIRWLS
jgi:hypothetical protein